MAGYETAIHADQFLTDLSVAYSNDTPRMGDMVLPPRPADKMSDLYAIYGTESFKRYDDIKRDMANPAEVRQTLTRGQFRAEQHELDSGVPFRYNREADVPLDPEVDATLNLTETMLNQREFNQLAVLSDPTQMTQNLALSGTSQWSDYQNSVPLTNIRAFRSGVRLGVHRPANTFLISADVDYTLNDHPAIKDLIKYTDPANLTEGGIPASIRSLRVLVSQTDMDTTPFNPTGTPPAAATFQAAFYKAALVAHVNPNMGKRGVTLGVTFEAPDPVTGGRGLQVRRIVDERKEGVWIRASDTYAIKIVAAVAGYLGTTVIA